VIRRGLKLLLRYFPVLVGVVLLLYIGDWSVFEVRAAHGSAYNTVQVDQFLATPLKGQKTEYDLMGTTQETCSRSIFPQKWHPPCWWLKRHASQWE
jgi:hypothetical protein